MFCPECQSEYREGITRCATCDVELVADVSAAPPRARATASVVAHEDLADYCGFLSLDEARQARERLRAEGIPSEIAIRDAKDEPTPTEEYWLRAEPSRFTRMASLLGYDQASESEEEEEDEPVACSECGEEVGDEETSCPHCGARFEE